MKRQKYKCKNIGEYKMLRQCQHKGCNEYGIVSYRNDPPSGGVKVTFRCIEHVHSERESDEVVAVIAEAKYRPYSTLVDYAAILEINHARVR